jgi:A/G-specific adenine glycosylase
MVYEEARDAAGERRTSAQGRLLAWYAAEGRSHLPWRHTRDPYAVLVSEVMLQQTQVDRVLPKYREFLGRFPTLQALAAAPASEAIKAWAGLGYNMRAVRLHEIARQAVAEYGGALPGTLDGLLALKGIGRYTAGAVACFAFGLPVATVDTNIRRVLWRAFHGIEPAVWPSGEKAVREALALAEWALPPDRAYDWQQALMDLGATVCAARRPACERCPLRDCCAAYAETARVTLFPSGEALARLRDERHAAVAAEPAPKPALALVAEAREGYAVGTPAGERADSGRNGQTARLAKRTTGRRFEETSRYFRGRIVAALRDLPADESLPLTALGARIRDGYADADAAWLQGLVDGLARDGLVRVESGPNGGPRVALP